MVIDDAYHTDREGRKRRHLSPDVQALFFVNSLEEKQEHSASHVHCHFTVGEDANKFAHMSLTGLLNWFLASGQSLNWRDVVARPTAVPGFDDFSKTVRRALAEKVVTHIFHIQPQSMPGFLNAA